MAFPRYNTMLMRSSRKSALTERWVLDASPLILLARIGQERLLHALADEVIIPQPVAIEILAGPDTYPAISAVVSGHFTFADSPKPPDELLAWDLGLGETSVLAHALADSTWTAIVDDGAARRCARSFDIPVKGTLAIVVLAKQRGLISSAAGILKQLVSDGFHTDERVVREVLERSVGEKTGGKTA
jgi:predicted nucleic acid-binding protein